MLPTSVFSERCFSAAHDICTADRNRLNREKAEMLNCIKLKSYLLDDI